MAAIYKRGKVFWIRYSVGGKQYRQSLCTRSRKVALREIERYERSLEGGTFQPPSETALETFLEGYFSYRRELRPKKSWKNEKNRVERFFSRTGVKWVEELTAAGIAEYLEGLAAASREGRWQPATYVRYREALVTLFDYAIERFGFVSRDPKHENPARGVRRRRIPKPEIAYLTEDQIRSLLDSLEEHRQMQAMVATLRTASAGLP